MHTSFVEFLILDAFFVTVATFKVMVPNKYKAKQRLQKLMEE